MKNSNIPPASRYTLPRVGWSVGKTAHIVKTPISDRSHIRFFVFFTYFVSCLPKPENHSWELLDVEVPTQLFWLQFWTALGIWPLCFFSFFVLLANGGEWAKRWILKVFGFSFDVITNRTKLKNNTPNALSSPYVNVFFFSRKRNFVRLFII